VDAISQFHPDAEPTNPVACGIPNDADPRAISPEIKDRMDLHQAVMLGDGFYKWMVHPDAVSLDKPGAKLRRLPVVNFLAFDDKQYADAIVEEALPVDRNRFRRYLSDRPLGIGIIIAVSQSCLYLSMPKYGTKTSSRDEVSVKRMHSQQLH
jgi:hypothetical protein